MCTNRPIRQDYLDEFVWRQLIQLLDDPSLIRSEIDRRMEAAQKADPRRKREEDLRREQVRLENSTERLVTAYQEGLLTLAELRQRMPHLRQQQQAVESELHSLKMAAADQSKYLRLAETLDDFRAKLRARASTLEVGERQKILRLLVKEVLVSSDRITIRHSIPIPQTGSGSSGSPSPNSSPGGSTNPGYLLRSRSHRSSIRRSLGQARTEPVRGSFLEGGGEDLLFSGVRWIGPGGRHARPDELGSPGNRSIQARAAAIANTNGDRLCSAAGADQPQRHRASLRGILRQQ